MSSERAQELSDKEKARQAHILLSRYISLYQQTHKRKPPINRYSAKWGMMDVIDSIGVERADQLLAFYFVTKNAHTIEFFYKNFDKMDIHEQAVREDRKRRAMIRKQTEERVREAGN